MAHDDEIQPIIIKKIKKGGGGGHGGAWKVAYADFVTAMMAFFLLLWLLNVTTDEQKAYISSYFAPADPRISMSTSGSGGVMGGKTMAEDGAQTSDKNPYAQQREPAAGVGKEDGVTGTDAPEGTGAGNSESAEEIEEAKVTAEMDAEDANAFAAAEAALQMAISNSPDLKGLSEHVLIDQTPEGLRIQIIDRNKKPMFEIGNANPLPRTRKLLAAITGIIRDLPNKISIRGHTDSKKYPAGAAYTNWELSADRANAARRIILANKLNALRIENIQGKADQEPLVEDNPADARNRRISIILLKQSVARYLDKTRGKKGRPARKKAILQPPKKREEGVIYFP